MAGGAHHFEAPDGPEGLEGPQGTADNVDNAGEGVAAKGLDAADEAGVAPVVGERQRRRNGRPDAEDDVHAEEQEEDRVCERAVLDCRVVHTHVPVSTQTSSGPTQNRSDPSWSLWSFLMAVSNRACHWRTQINLSVSCSTWSQWKRLPEAHQRIQAPGTPAET
jgi:hypothetical protein